MHPRTQELLNHLDHHHAVLRDAVADVPPAHRDLRPAPDRWSVAEIVQHLAIVEGRVTQALSEKLAAARASGLGPDGETGAVVDPRDVAMLLDRSGRITAPEASGPTPGVTADAALAMLDEARRHLRALVLSADGLAAAQIIHPHPRFGPLTFHRWVVFMGGHEARHTLQIREAAAAFAP